MTNLTTLSNSELQQKATQYDLVNNEGREGYNPFSEELDRRSYETEKDRPKSLSEQEASILKELSRKDCSIARESGTFDQKEVTELRAKLKAVRTEKEQSFFSEWTREETISRRHKWNSSMADKARNGEKVNLIEESSNFGFSIEDLKKAVTHYKLPKWCG